MSPAGPSFEANFSKYAWIITTASFRTVIGATIPIVSSQLDLPRHIVPLAHGWLDHPAMVPPGWCWSEGNTSLFEGGPLDQDRY